MHNERRKGTWGTPLSIAIISVLMTAGFVFLGYCGDTAIRALDTHFSTIEQKQDMLYRKVADSLEKENRDVLCLNSRVFACCGEKANVSC